MKRNMSIVILLMLLSGSLFVSQAYAKGEGTTNSVTLPSSVPGEILVKSKPGKSINEINSLFGSSTLRVDKRSGVQKVKLPPGESVSYMVSQYANNPDVEYAEPNFVSKISDVPNDSYYPNQWALTKINAPQAWDISKGSPSVVIAIIDSGIDYNHPDLRDKIVSPYNSVIDSTSITSVLDDVGHGTHVAGIAAATIDNGIGIAGVGGNISIMPIKAGYGGSFYSYDEANAIYYAVDHGARVINMSLGGTGYSYTVKNAVDYAWSHNVVVVAAAGNKGTSTPQYPAAFSSVISVAATDQSDVDASFSNWGDWIEISAPGVNIYSTTPTYANSFSTNYDYLTGTSMASPIVAGLAALTVSAKPTLTNHQIRGLIDTNADDIDTPGYDYYTGNGRVNAYRTLTAAMASSPSASALPAGGNYNNSQIVTLSASQPNCTIFYTIDGSDPTLNGSEYTGPISISSTTDLKYYALGLVGTSSVYTETYTIQPPTVSAVPAGDTYTSPQSVTLTASQSDCTIYYTTDGSNPTTSSSQYYGPIAINTATTLKYFAIGETGTSQVSTQVYTIVSTATISPPGGLYDKPQQVTLSMTGLGGNIFYTLDGTNPTLNSSVFSQSITISSQTVIKYIAVDKYGNQSQIYSQTYTYTIKGLITESTRLAGNDRLATAVAISQRTFPESHTANAVLLATGLNFPDALAGASLGKIKDAPLLLVTTYQNSKVTLDEIQRVLKPSGTVYILGGEGVVAPVFVTDLQRRGYDIRRLAGLNRYATAVAIAKEVKVSGGGEVIVATGQNFPDSLSISPYAAANGIPMVLVNQNEIPTEVENYLNTLQPSEITIVGGAGVVSTSVESGLKQLLPSITTRRFGGIDRFETCVKITQELFGNNSSSLFVATGIDFPDALAGSVLAGFNNAPIILIKPTEVPNVILGYITQLNHKKVVALGGERVVSREVYTNIIGYIQ